METTTLKYQSKSTRLKDVVLEDIRKGRYDAAQPLPAENSLAEIYGVSRSTIRRVVELLTRQGELFKEPNRGSWIRTESKKVLQSGSADQVYKPGKLQHYRFGLAWAAFPDALTAGIGEGIKSYAREHHIGLQIFNSSENHEPVLSVLTHAEEFGLDGLIILPYESDQYLEALGRLKAKGFPLVCVDRPVPGLALNTVDVDNAFGMYEATHHLIMKYKQPVYFFGPWNENHTERMRYEGYARAMMDAGFEQGIREKYTINVLPTENLPEYWPMEKKWLQPFNTAAEFLRQVDLPVNVVCMNDYMARGVYEAAKELKMIIGRDIRVIGFDDLPMARCMTPPLTTVQQPRFQIGYEAARLLHKLLNEIIKRPVNVTLPVEFIERQSS